MGRSWGRRSAWYTCSLFISVLLLGAATARAELVREQARSATGESWHGDTRRYRVTLVAGAAGFARTDKVAEASLDLGALLNAAGGTGTVHLASLRLVEVTLAGDLLDATVPFQFDGTTSGTLVWLMEGSTAEDATRYYQLYFDTFAYSPVSFGDGVVVADGVADEGQVSFRISTIGGIYYYQKEGAGFSSLLDSEGNDWIRYNSAVGSAGEYRGIPNMVYSTNTYHPGYTNASSTLVHDGPLKATVESPSDDGMFRVRWEFYPAYARMTVLQSTGNYWFLYEGTPGGQLDRTAPNNDFLVRSDGTQYSVAQSWTGGRDIPGDEWVYFADPLVGKSLFLAHHDNDAATDWYQPLDYPSGGPTSDWMTVFGFGRAGASPRLNGPRQFTIGLLETTQYEAAGAEIRSAYKDLAVTVGMAQSLAEGPSPVCGDGSVGPGEQCDDGNDFGGDGCQPDCTRGRNELLSSPRPGEVYKEFTVVMTGARNWRVTDPNATAVGSPGNSPADFLPNPQLPIEIDDLAGAVRAEVVIDLWGGHVGTSGKRFRLNGNAWIDIPELSTTPTDGECYTQQLNVVREVPLGDLVQGTNLLEGTSGPQTCYSFNWGQWGWYLVTIRVYYDPATKPHPSGVIVSPVSGEALAENPTLEASVESGIGISRVEFVGCYDDYDTDGDGFYDDYQRSYHRGPTETSMNISNHIGDATAAPWSVTWDTQFVPNQPPAGIRLHARIRDINGVWYVTEEVAGLSLVRDPETSVQLYRSTGVPENLWIRAGALRSVSIPIPQAHDLEAAVAARLYVRTWNGIDGAAESGEEHYTEVNGWTAPSYGENHYYSFDRLNVPLWALANGPNAVRFYSESTHHGIEVLWPGPALAVRYAAALADCGNGTLDAGEECDDGNTQSGDECSDQCEAQICGDAFVGGNEDCDDGNLESGDGCDAECVLEVCGNGRVQVGEECDDGNTVDVDDCGNDCLINYCGDAQTNAGEECDDGNAADDDLCGNDCLFNFCGDGEANNGEECDDGNVVDDDFCGNDCLLNYCGDGQVNPAEQCDDGGVAIGDGCDERCLFEVCGNGAAQIGEDCDDGNAVDDDSCANDCTQNYCGDGELNNHELCDDGNDVENDGCDPGCAPSVVLLAERDPGSEQLRLTWSGGLGGGFGIFRAVDASRVDLPWNRVAETAVREWNDQPPPHFLFFYRVRGLCGNGETDIGESCDDGNAFGGDGCRIDCTDEVCGDGLLDAGEACDDGNADPTDGCRPDCTLARCGDGIVDPEEVCDDGNMVAGDGCRADCTAEICGDGILDESEGCDDGNPDVGDGCRPDCTLEGCGDAVLDPGEVCDDGNLVAGDGCRPDCTPEVCGDGLLDPGEECDAGELNSDLTPDACRTDCLLAGCGDQVLDTGEQCDDGNPFSGDGCDASCSYELQNALVNGDFENGKASWLFYSDQTASFSVVNGEARIYVTVPGNNVQLHQYNIGILGGRRYRISFRARSLGGHDVKVILQRHTAPNTNYGLNQLFDLTPTSTDFSFEFETSSADTSDTRLMFWFAPYDQAGSDYYFDDIKLELLPETP